MDATPAPGRRALPHRPGRRLGGRRRDPVRGRNRPHAGRRRRARAARHPPSRAAAGATPSRCCSTCCCSACWWRAWPSWCATGRSTVATSHRCW
ncbi:hypothetical protein CAY91_35140, partial [Pseudomonas aeruginosa]